MESRVIDTNILIVSSAADDASPFEPNNTPIPTEALRKKVLTWLMDFEQDKGRKIVLDGDWLIAKEYQNKLTDQDYGSLVWQAKIDRNEVFWVTLDVDQDGHAIVPETLESALTDLADRKMVAAVLAVKVAYGGDCKLVNACDTDWLDCAAELEKHEVQCEHVVEEWLKLKWKEHHER